MDMPGGQVLTAPWQSGGRDSDIAPSSRATGSSRTSGSPFTLSAEKGSRWSRAPDPDVPPVLVAPGFSLNRAGLRICTEATN